jgi:hypothetical protein
MWILIKMIDAIGVKERSAAFDAMDFVPFRKKELREIRAVLPGNARK